MKLFLIFVLIAVSQTQAFQFQSFTNQGKGNFNGTNWAVLVAGSNGYYNYRHQADVCHAYHVLHDHGIPDDNIIVMMYDDIAYNSQNPKKGVIINKPGGPNVYPGCLKDYVGEEVTPENFLGALSGDASLAAKGKKVVKSGPNDNIFVYFTDHGAPGIIAFPSTELSATKLNEVLKTMHQNNRYSKMVIYIEACESGSMFENLLPNNLNIYATTASDSRLPSYACYWDQELSTYLGDCYSVNWIEDSDKSNLRTETLQQQYETVKRLTTTSPVMEFGDFSFHPLPLSDFQGNKIAAKDEIHTGKHFKDAFPSADVPIAIASANAERSEEDRKIYYEMIAARQFLRFTMLSLTEVLSAKFGVSVKNLWYSKEAIKDHKCYEYLYKSFGRNCFNLSQHPYALRYLYIFVNLCNAGQHIRVSSVENAMTEYCIKLDTNRFDRIL